MSLTVGAETRDEVTVIGVRGELDLATAAQLADLTSRLIDEGACFLVYDLSGLTFCDSTGLTVFVRARNRLDQTGGRLAVAAATPIVSRVLEVSGLLQVLDAHPTVPAAVAAVAGEPQPEGH